MSMKIVHECQVCVSCGACSFLCVCSALHISSTRDEYHVCVAVCCSVLQCVAVCCSVLQCVAVCCSVLQCVAVMCAHIATRCVLQIK